MSNSIDSNALLAQLRTMAAQAGMPDVSKTSIPVDEPKTDFTEIMKQSVDAVNDRQTHARNLAEAFERGDAGVELSQVMIEMQKARISFETLSQVRNKAVSAYQEIMNMSI